MNGYIQGFGVGAGLIMAIGAQNAFVLSQGIKKQYQWVVAAICSLSDCLLIAAGTAGLGSIVASNPSLSRFAGQAGAVFLLIYGAKSIRSAFKNQRLEESDQARVTLTSVVITTLALTFLNPHVYLDTVLLLGSVSAQYPGAERTMFGLGACTASIAWFFCLSLAGIRLRPVFQRPGFWRMLDIFIALTMWGIAFTIWPREGGLI